MSSRRGCVAPLGWALLLAGAFAVRAVALDAASFWRDEVDTVLFSSRGWDELVRAFATPQHNGPAFHILLRAWIDAAGTSEYAVRYPSALADVLALCLVAALGGRVAGRAGQIVAGALWAVSPAAVWYAREAKMYAWLAALGALC